MWRRIRALRAPGFKSWEVEVGDTPCHLELRGRESAAEAYQGADGWDVTPDGQRLSTIKESASQNAGRLVMVQNFFTELKRLLPVD